MLILLEFVTETLLQTGSENALSAPSLPILATRKKPLPTARSCRKNKNRDCSANQNFLCCVSVFLIHCSTSLLLTGMVQGMVCFFVHEWELELCSSNCEFWLLMLGDGGSPVLEVEPTARWDRTARAVHSLYHWSKGKLVAGESYMSDSEMWWRITDWPPFCHLCYQASNTGLTARQTFRDCNLLSCPGAVGFRRILMILATASYWIFLCNYNFVPSWNQLQISYGI